MKTCANCANEIRNKANNLNYLKEIKLFIVIFAVIF